MAAKMRQTSSEFPIVLLIDAQRVSEPDIKILRQLVEDSAPGLSHPIHMEVTTSKDASEKPKTWKPSLSGADTPSGSVGVCPYDKALKQLKSHLNKLTGEKYSMISKDIRDLFVKEFTCPAAIEKASTCMLDKSITDPEFSCLYARLCVLLYHTLGTEFHSRLLRVCQRRFNDLKSQVGVRDSPRLKRELNGLLVFLSSLYVQTLLSLSIFIGACLMPLMASRHEVALESVCQSLETIQEFYSTHLTSERQKIFDEVLKILNEFREGKESPLPTRTRFRILDVLESYKKS
jgi:hypothetical protein